MQISVCLEKTSLCSWGAERSDAGTSRLWWAGGVQLEKSEEIREFGVKTEDVWGPDENSYWASGLFKDMRGWYHSLGGGTGRASGIYL